MFVKNFNDKLKIICELWVKNIRKGLKCFMILII